MDSKVFLHLPAMDELTFKRSMLKDEATMSYNHAYGGTIDFSCDRWPSWYERWILDEKNHYYRYLRTMKGEFVGEIALHKDEGRWFIDILIEASFRNRGYGSQGLDYLIEEAKRRKIDILYDEIAKDNPSLPLFLNNGFVIESTNDQTIILKAIL